MEREICESCIVFTDLDGTLIDFETYSPNAARPALEVLGEFGVPVVFCSSKTFAEQLELQNQLEMRSPCIVENGAAIVFPEEFFDVPPVGSVAHGTWQRYEMGIESAEVLKIVKRVEQDLGLSLEGYSGLSIREVVEKTGLSREAAMRAGNRDYSETLTLKAEPEFWTRVSGLFEEMGLKCLHGGRFHTVMDSSVDKGRAVREFVSLVDTDTGKGHRSIGMGDSRNDVDMFKAVDEAYQVQNAAGEWSELGVDRAQKVEGIGPIGWTRSLMERFAV